MYTFRFRKNSRQRWRPRDLLPDRIAGVRGLGDHLWGGGESRGIPQVPSSLSLSPSTNSSRGVFGVSRISRGLEKKFPTSKNFIGKKS